MVFDNLIVAGDYGFNGQQSVTDILPWHG